MKPDTCGCCQPAVKPTPVTIYNRPGLSALAYRVGTFAAFRQAMLQAIAGMPELAGLRTRQRDDYAITLLELWAIIGDILTFYQERLANEAFLRTARLRESVLRLTRLLDYHLRPGVAATAYLAFTLEKEQQVQIPVGLRVQSVPGPEEQPQKFETLEHITADVRLNRLRILPGPVGVNPLAQGKTEAFLAPGSDGLAAAAALTAGDRLLVFSDTAVEALKVREIRPADDRLILAWTDPIQGSAWDVHFEPRKLGRTFRLFGYNAPPTYMKADEPQPGLVTWTLINLTAWDGAGTPGEDSYGLAAANEVYLERQVEDLKPGTQFLVVDEGQTRVVQVDAVSQAPARLGSLSDTVTKLKLYGYLPDIKDRRQVLIHELEGPPIHFWGYEFPPEITTPAIFLPCRRLGPEKVEVSRTIEQNAYQEGVQLALKDLEVGRTVILQDEAHPPLVATINRASVAGLEVRVGPTPEDADSVTELGLNPRQSRFVTVSSPFSSTPQFTSPNPQIWATIGPVGPRLVRLSGPLNDLDAIAQSLEAGLKAAHGDKAFSQARVLCWGSFLLIFPGVGEVQVWFAPTPEDRTTVRELGLDPKFTDQVVGLASAPLEPFPSVSADHPELAVTIGPVGPRPVTLAEKPASLEEATLLLKDALNAADLAPAFLQALVGTFQNRLVLFPGGLIDKKQEFLVLDLETTSPFILDSRAAVLSGNVALASHGETVKNEVLGDGDQAARNQSFTLRNKLVSFIPSARAGGVQNSLNVLVNGVNWHEVPGLYGQTPEDRVYTTRLADEGTMTLQFGDGKTGARLPTGRHNVLARYRQGLGLAGRVRAQSLTTLLDRPVGLKSALNPAPAEGGADPETLTQARRNAPTTVRTFGRAVSLRDFEDLVTASGEVAKAQATWVWCGATRTVHLTVAGQRGGHFSDEALARLHAGLTAHRDRNHPLILSNYLKVPVVVQATLGVDPAYVAKEAEAAARAALLAALSFEELRFGQPLHLSDIYRVLQDTHGVLWVDVDLFHFKDRSPAHLEERRADEAPLQQHVRIYPARPHPNPPPLVLPGEQAEIEVPSQDIGLVTSGGLPL